MTSADTIALLNDCEARYPVDCWSIGGLRIWPLLRVRLYTVLVYHHLGTGLAGAGAQTPGKRLLNAAGGLGRSLLRSGGRRRRGDGGAAVLLSDGVSLSRIEGRLYDRIMDPIVDSLASTGHQALLLMPTRPHAGPFHTPPIFVQPLLDAIKLAATIAARRRRPEVALEGMEEMLSTLGRAYPDVGLPDRTWLLGQAGRVEAMARYFGRILRRAAPRAALVNTYYGAEGMAFLLAARRLGCATADVQHGLQIDHVAYGTWRRIPPEGYELLPRFFLCWSDEDAARINDNSAGTQKGLTIGNSWAHYWRDEAKPVVRAAVATLAGLKAGSGARWHALVTPSAGMPQADLDVMIDAIAQAPKTIFWWVRLHPNQAAERATIRQRLAGAGGAVRSNLDAATDLPLPVLLAAVDVNVTQSSTTVLEARAERVPSVIVTDYGASIFGAEIARGSSRVAKTPAAIIEAVTDLAAHNPLAAGEADAAAESALGPALAELLRFSEPPQARG